MFFQVNQLNSLVNLLVGELSPGDRQKVMTLCTIDVHSRDVLARLVQQKVETSQAFAWQSQLRHRYSYSLSKHESETYTKSNAAGTTPKTTAL